MPSPVISTNRLEAFSDGVFAIVITLLVLELKLPPGPAPLALKLRLMEPQMAAFVGSFIIVGMTWIGHHGLFHLIKRVDKSLMWLNFLELIFVSFIPFPTMILGLHPMDPDSVRFFALVLVLIGVAYNLIWWYASLNHRLIYRDMDRARIRRQWIRGFSFTAAYMLAFLLTFISVKLGFLVLVLVPIQFIWPSRFDARMYKTVGSL